MSGLKVLGTEFTHTCALYSLRLFALFCWRRDIVTSVTISVGQVAGWVTSPLAGRVTSPLAGHTLHQSCPGATAKVIPKLLQASPFSQCQSQRTEHVEQQEEDSFTTRGPLLQRCSPGGSLEVHPCPQGLPPSTAGKGAHLGRAWPYTY